MIERKGKCFKRITVSWYLPNNYYDNARAPISYTIFNIQEFNPNVIGYALGDSLTIHEISQLNVAESGSISRDMPYMAEMLIKRIKSDPRIDVEKHWKVRRIR